MALQSTDLLAVRRGEGTFKAPFSQVETVINALADDRVIQSPTAPTNPEAGTIWVDTSISPPEMKVWDPAGGGGSGAWEPVGGGAETPGFNYPPAALPGTVFVTEDTNFTTDTQLIEFSLAGGAYSDTAAAAAGQSVTCRWKADAAGNTPHGGTVSETMHLTTTTGVIDGTFSFTVDRLPDPININSKTEVDASSVVESDASTAIAGTDAPSRIWLASTDGTNAEVSVAGGAWTAIPATDTAGVAITTGQTFMLRHTTQAGASTVTTTVVNVGWEAASSVQATFETTNAATRAPVITSVTLADVAGGDRFTSTAFPVTVTMADEGLPASTKGLKGYVEGTLNVSHETDVIVNVTETSADPATYLIPRGKLSMYDTTAGVTWAINEKYIFSTRTLAKYELPLNPNTAPTEIPIPELQGKTFNGVVALPDGKVLFMPTGSATAYYSSDGGDTFKSFGGLNTENRIASPGTNTLAWGNDRLFIMFNTDRVSVLDLPLGLDDAAFEAAVATNATLAGEFGNDFTKGRILAGGDGSCVGFERNRIYYIAPGSTTHITAECSAITTQAITGAAWNPVNGFWYFFQGSSGLYGGVAITSGLSLPLISAWGNASNGQSIGSFFDMSCDSNGNIYGYGPNGVEGFWRATPPYNIATDWLRYADSNPAQNRFFDETQYRALNGVEYRPQDYIAYPNEMYIFSPSETTLTFPTNLNLTQFSNGDLITEVNTDGSPGDATGTTNSVDTGANTMSVVGSSGTWTLGSRVKGPPKPTAGARLYTVLDNTGAVSDLQSSDPGFVAQAATPTSITFPATFPTGDAPDTELPAGTTLKVEVEATNTVATVSAASNTITPA
jgi:hypothetical protein